MTDLGHDFERLADALELRLPDLRPMRPLSVLGRGFRSLAVETAGGQVIRVGCVPEAAQDYAREWRIRPFIARHLADLAPVPAWYAPPCAELPHGALGYAKLPGTPPVWGVHPGAPFVRDLGGFMARLHALPPAEARSAGVPEVDAYGRLLRARPVVMPILAIRLQGRARTRLEAWWDAFARDDRLRAPRRAVGHHDLWHHNLLRSDAGRLSGVLDMAHLEVTDPAHDFAAPRYFGDACMVDLITAYRAAGGRFDADDRYRAARLFEAREFGGLAWAIEHHDQPEIDAAIGKILSGPLLSP